MGSLVPADTGSGQEAGFLATRVDALVNWGRKNSLWPMPLGLSCCGIELMAMIGPKFDIARFGAEAARFSPRQCDLMIVAGTLTWKMAEAARTIYDQMPEPKWVIAMGACAISGGPFKQGYNVLKGIDRYIPVDVYLPGCPPRPEAVLQSLNYLQEKIRTQDIRQDPAFTKGRRQYPVPEFTGTDLEPPFNPEVWSPPNNPNTKPLEEATT